MTRLKKGTLNRKLIIHNVLPGYVVVDDIIE